MMKGKLLKTLLLMGISITCLGGCHKEIDAVPTLECVREIADLSTTEAYIHNVAKSVKKAGSGFWNIGKTDRRYWVEYSAKINLGIKVSDVNIEVDGDHVKVTIPAATILSYGITDLNEESIVRSGDNWWNSNKITDEEQKRSVDLSLEESVLKFQSSKDIFVLAQTRAKELIENYINELGQAADKTYEIEWVLEPYTVPKSVEEDLKVIEEERQKLEEGK